MGPSAATTGPGVMFPPRDRVHSTRPVEGPVTEAVAECALSCNASGHAEVAAVDATATPPPASVAMATTSSASNGFKFGRTQRGFATSPAWQSQRARGVGNAYEIRNLSTAHHSPP